MTVRCENVVVGASASGLAVARCLQQEGLSATVLEQHPNVGHPWRMHYDRLHLHTPKGGSALPHMKMPGAYPKYPAREQVVEYLEAYAQDLQAPIHFNERVVSIRQKNGEWLTSTEKNDYASRNVIVATGYTRKPYIPAWDGTDQFRGDIVHSSEYKNGERYRNRNVLVVGFGNSACEIAICLHEHGAKPTMAVRGPVNVVPRDILGIPILSLGIVQAKLSPGLADTLNAPLMRLLVGDITKYGLQKAAYGPATQINTHHQIPLLDIGTMKLIKTGKIIVRPGIDRFTATGVVFSDGREEAFDAVVLGTGYRPGVNEFLDDAGVALDEDGTPRLSGQETGVPGLYFCGFRIVTSGGLREFGLEAQRIAKLISAGNRVAIA